MGESYVGSERIGRLRKSQRWVPSEWAMARRSGEEEEEEEEEAREFGGENGGRGGMSRFA